MSVLSTLAAGYSVAAPSELSLYVCSNPKRATRGMIVVHGHGADCTQFAMTGQNAAGIHVPWLAREGYRVLSVDAGGTVAWSNSTAMARVDDAYSYLTGTLGSTAGKVAILAYSMGALTALNWIKRNPAKVGAVWLWSPVTDLDWAQAQASWTAEINSAFGGNYATNSVGYRVHDEYASWQGICPIKVAHAQDDSVVPYSQSQNFITGVNDANVTLRSIATGNHSLQFAAVPPSEIVTFFRGALAA